MTESGWVERQLGHPVIKVFNTIRSWAAGVGDNYVVPRLREQTGKRSADIAGSNDPNPSHDVMPFVRPGKPIAR
jgi:hypothetical protein